MVTLVAWKDNRINPTQAGNHQAPGIGQGFLPDAQRGISEHWGSPNQKLLSANLPSMYKEEKELDENHIYFTDTELH